MDRMQITVAQSRALEEIKGFFQKDLFPPAGNGVPGKGALFIRSPMIKSLGHCPWSQLPTS